MGKVTYMIGAGASAAAIPIVKDTNKEINALQNFVSDKVANMQIGKSDKETTEKWKVFSEALKEFVNESANHQSFDTYAKKLWIKNDMKTLKRMKAVLTCFYIYKHHTKPIDRRYDSFIASLWTRETRSHLPDHLNILSWNYDYQLEMAYREYSNNAEFRSEIIGLNIQPNDLDSFLEGFTLFKLNGTAVLVHENNGRMSHTVIDDNLPAIEQDPIAFIVDRFHKILKDKYDSSLHFAWEDDEIYNLLRKRAKERTEDTQVLVVIGYSFPFFNRELDRSLILSMTNLEKVYLQAPAEGLTRMRDGFRALQHPDMSKIEIEEYSDTDQFFLPPEL